MRDLSRSADRLLRSACPGGHRGTGGHPSSDFGLCNTRHATSLASPSRRKGQGINKSHVLEASHGGSRRQPSLWTSAFSFRFQDLSEGEERQRARTGGVLPD